MKKVAFVVVLLLCSHICLSQINSGPSPTIGWDSLKSLLRYPELARRAGLERIVLVTVDVSSTGEIININVSSDAPIFTESVKQILSDIKWNPAMKNSHAVQGTVKFPINFVLTDEYEGPNIIIEAQRAKLQVNPAAPPIKK